MARLSLRPFVLGLSTLLLTILQVHGQAECDGIQQELKPNQLSRFTAKSKGCFLVFSLDFGNSKAMDLLNKKLVLHVSVDDRIDPMNPLIVMARHQASTTQVIVPYTFGSDYINAKDTDWNYEANRTLCLYKQRAAARGQAPEYQSNHIIHITVETSARNGIPFNLMLSLTEGLLLTVGTDMVVTVRPTASTWFIFQWPENATSEELVEIVLSSKDDNGMARNDSHVCTLVAADDSYCPVYDLEETITKLSEYKRMTSSAVLRISRSNPRYKDGFTIMIIPLANDNSCNRSVNSTVFQNSKERTKIIKLTSRKPLTGRIHKMLEIQLVWIFLPFAAFGLTVFFVCHYIFLLPLYNKSKAGVIQIRGHDGADGVTAAGPVMTYADVLARAPPLKLERPSPNRYCTVTFFISAFFSIPVIQFIYYIWQSMSDSGNFDSCYYNELCRLKSSEDLHDTNHFVSNLLYVVFGILFIALVHWRRQSLLGTPEYLQCKRGLRVPFGGYIALGLALIMEGILSCFYHFCPSGSTFQFDVAFMYVIAVLIISIPHQLRFVANPSGTKAFLLLTGLTLTAGVISVLDNKASPHAAFAAQSLFAAIHVGFMLIYCTGLYYYGIVKDGNGAWYTDFYGGIYQSVKSLTCGTGLQVTIEQVPDMWLKGTRVLVYSLLFLTNAALAPVLIAKKVGFAHYLLYVLIWNAVASTIIYSLWKLVHWYREQSGGRTVGISSALPFAVQTGTYFLIALLCGVYAGHHFTTNVTDWKGTAAESRAMNQRCIELWRDIFDYHDVWHFFSAVALFFSFLALLTNDDGLIMTERSEIHIF